MRHIAKIVIHCSATPEGRNVTAADIARMHRERGFAGIGYHRFVRLDGTVEQGRADHIPGSHVKGHNFDSIGVCYAGGVGKDGKAKDTRTPDQKLALASLIRALLKKYPGAKVMGHRDLSPDLNRNGRIEKHEWMKECPSFSVADWLKEAGIV